MLIKNIKEKMLGKCVLCSYMMKLLIIIIDMYGLNIRYYTLYNIWCHSITNNSKMNLMWKMIKT